MSRVEILAGEAVTAMDSTAHPVMWVSLEEREGTLTDLRSGKQCLTTNAQIAS